MASGNSVVPKYHQIYLVLREQILEGRFADAFPGEHQLAETYQVSRVTLRRAMDELKSEGLIERERGRGTRAVQPARSKGAGAPASAAKTDISGLLENIIALGLRTSVKVVEVSTIACPADVARVLQIAPETPVQKAVRVRSHRGAPMSFITTYIPHALAGHLGRKELEKKPMLSLLEESGVKIGDVQQSLGAELADSRVAAHLDVQVGSALLAVRRVVRDKSGAPVQMLLGLYRPDRYEYRMQLPARGPVTTQVWAAD
ncbi:GntR family transcriptional regulator [Variovorax sp. VNK109]|uniref:GntR family transcriptional regulator n=1 Tax=Variovorax sp. VNK109 TaxID=3400919 RepID=UPI003C0EE771